VRLNYWLRLLFAVPPKRRTRTAAAAVEALEDRTLLSTLTVNTTADTVDVDPGDGVAEDSNGETSLRAAVMEANATVERDTIMVPAGTYELSNGGQFEDLGFTGDLDIRQDLSIVGVGRDLTIIDGNDLDRVMQIHANVDVELRSLQLREGFANSTNGYDGYGGAIFNNGHLSLSAITITDSRAGRHGGGLFNRGSLVVEDGLFVGINDDAGVTYPQILYHSE
jgi:hypothetical protein